MSIHYKKHLFLFRILAILFLPLAARSQECEKVKISDFPKQDIPPDLDTARARRAGIREESYKYYYGIGVPVDYVKARQLAFTEWAVHGDGSDPIAGPSILLMLYANGFGVRRDLGLCIRLACANVGFADAEIEGRVEHLKAMQSGDSTRVFDICDDITSGYMSGYCASVHSELAEIARKARIDSVIATWPEKDRAAYRELSKAASNFFTERALREVDMSGTARVAIETEESESLEDGLLARILDANTCAIPTYTAQEFMAADKKLNAIYKKVMDSKKPARGTVTMEGTVTMDGIRSTQRTWIEYRDAWVVFGAVRCPGVSENSWKALITEERIRQLESFMEE